MLDIAKEKCKYCEVAIAFLVKFRISEEEQKRLCRVICPRKKQETDQLDLFELGVL
jgi:hypothetical protein